MMCKFAVSYGNTNYGSAIVDKESYMSFYMNSLIGKKKMQ